MGTAVPAAAVMMRVFSTSAGMVARLARAPAAPPIAMYCHASSSRGRPPHTLPAHVRTADDVMIATVEFVAVSSAPAESLAMRWQ